MATKEEKPAVPDFHLIVVHPFGSYTRGQKITDFNEVESIKASANSHHCNKVPVA
jgi:hypothetical protein